MVAIFLERMVTTERAWGEIYKSLAQLVLLYVRESWVVTGDMLKVLEGFHHWETQRITGMTAKLGAGG